MIQRLSHVAIYVLDQDEAYDFYVNKLGFEVRMDAKMDNGFRWLTVGPKGQPNLQIVLMPTTPSHAMDQETSDALRALAGSFMATGAGTIDLAIDDEIAMRLSPEQSTHVLAIAKEALSNSIRHTKAAKRMLTLGRHGKTIRLEISDNGRGFSLARRGTPGMGLKNMRARGRKLRGRIAISSAPNKGTTVTLTIPSA